MKPFGPLTARSAVPRECIVKHLNYLIDNIYVALGERTFQQLVGIPMGTNYLAIYSYSHMNSILYNKNELGILPQFLFTARYIDDIK